MKAELKKPGGATPAGNTPGMGSAPGTPTHSAPGTPVPARHQRNPSEAAPTEIEAK